MLENDCKSNSRGRPRGDFGIYSNAADQHIYYFLNNFHLCFDTARSFSPVWIANLI